MRKPTRTAPVRLLSLLAVLGCHTGPAAPSPLSVAVDSGAYHRHQGGPLTIRFTLTNGGTTVLFLPQCDGLPSPAIERISWGTWRFWQGGFCNGGTPPPLPLPPGGTLRGSVVIAEGGHFRLAIGSGFGREGETDLMAFSREFDVW